jgi:hypothetical protein
MAVEDKPKAERQVGRTSENGYGKQRQYIIREITGFRAWEDKTHPTLNPHHKTQKKITNCI